MNVIELEKDPVHGWCTFFPEGIDRFPKLYAPVCKQHDILTVLVDTGKYGVVSLHGHQYTWRTLGIDTPWTTYETDIWMRDAILDIATYHPDLTRAERRRVKRDAWIAFHGLRTFGVIYRSLT